jgi:hypothetical protein
LKTHNKTRGKYFEDVISEKIRTFLKIPESELHRNPFSGRSKLEYGDIRIPFDCVLECKFYQNWTVENTFLKHNKQLEEWWNQLEEEFLKYEKDKNIQPLKSLIISKPHGNIYSVLDKNQIYDYIDKLSFFISFDRERIVVKFDEFLNILNWRFFSIDVKN